MNYYVIDTTKKAEKYLQDPENFKGRTWIVARNYFDSTNKSGQFMYTISNKGNHCHIDIPLFNGLTDIKQMVELAKEKFSYAEPLVIIDLDRLNLFQKFLKRMKHFCNRIKILASNRLYRLGVLANT